nr:MAG TPA: Head Tail Connector Protein [Caudoviricetes sp.]
MAYTGYVDEQFYRDVYKGVSIPSDDIGHMLTQASRHIDSLTFNRIVAKGFDNLTAFQQDIIKEVICRQADFEFDNADIIDTVLQGYGINGVSMQFNGNGWNVYADKGVAIKKDLYSLLSQTGLTARLVGA